VLFRLEQGTSFTCNGQNALTNFTPMSEYINNDFNNLQGIGFDETPF